MDNKSMHFEMITAIVALLPILIYSAELFLDSESDERKNSEERLEKKMKNKYNDGFFILINSLFLLSPEEWKFSRTLTLKSLIKQYVIKSLQNQEITQGEQLTAEKIEFETIKPALVMFAICDRMQELMKGTGGEQKEGCGPNKGAKWIKDFEENVQNNFDQVHEDWISLGEEIEDEIMEVSDLKTAFDYCNLSQGNPSEFINSALQ